MTRCVWTLLGIALVAGAQVQPVGKPDPNLPEPPVVDPGGPGRPPSDAIVLFNGKDLAGWTRRNGSPTGCTIADGAMSCRTGSGDAYSKERFGSAQIHLEFAIPSMPDQRGQMKGNSGVFVQGCYEIQILDSYRNPTYPNGQAGSIYGQSAPLVNASLPPEQWQTYDIIFQAPRCDASGKVLEHGAITLLHNGVLVQNHFRLQGAGLGCDRRTLCEPGPLRLQDHSGFPNAPDTTMRFRNIWIRKLE